MIASMCSIASIALFLCLGLSHAQSDVTLTFQPPGEPGNVFKKGAYIKVTCKAKEEFLDVLQVMKITNEGPEEISTNNLLTDKFRKTNRYALLSSNSGGFRQTQISIMNMNGEDSGQIECWHTLIDETRAIASASVTVLVPPESVEIFQYNEGDVAKVVPGGKLVLREGEDHGIICKATVAGSDDQPTVEVTLGGHNVNDRFTKEEEKSESGVPGLRQKGINVMYEFLTSEPNIADNGQVLKCSVSTRGYDAISQDVTVEVHYAPRLECDEVSGSVGQSVQIVCRGTMFPALELASFSWIRGPDTYIVSLEESGTDRHKLILRENGTNYFFLLTIDDLKPSDFGKYSLEVQNAHSPSQQEIVLEEILTTTPEPSSEPTTASSAGTVTVDYVIITGKEIPPKPEVGESTGENAASPVPFSLSAMFAMLVLLACLH